MQPRKFENPQVLKVEDGRVTVSPGMWRGDDGVRATGTVVSVRKVTDASGNPANWPVVFGATEVPPAWTKRPWFDEVVFTGESILLTRLDPGDYRLELWRGSATTLGNTPGSGDVWEWGHESSDFGPSNAVVTFTIPGVAPPPPPPPASGDYFAKEALDRALDALDAWTYKGVPESKRRNTAAWVAVAWKQADPVKRAEIVRLLGGE